MATIPVKNLIPGAGATETLKSAGTPVNGTSGTYAGRAAVGVLLVDTVNFITYQNSGSTASPTWTKVGTQT